MSDGYYKPGMVFVSKHPLNKRRMKILSINGDTLICQLSGITGRFGKRGRKFPLRRQSLPKTLWVEKKGGR